MTQALASAPARTHRLIPSRFMPIQAFDGVQNAAEMEAVMELEGWTNDRLVLHRLQRLPRSEWVFGRPNASIVMAAFLHASDQGSRFTGPDLGAWYAASSLETAFVEIANGVRREIALSALEQKTEEEREYTARLCGDFVDIRGDRPDLHDPDPTSYAASQRFGSEVCAGPNAGIVYDSVRHPGGVNWVAYRPTLIQDVVQGSHFRITIPLSGKVSVTQLSSTA